MTTRVNYITLNIGLKMIMKVNSGYVPVADFIRELDRIINANFEMKDEPSDGNKPENYWAACTEIHLNSIGQEEDKNTY